MSSGSGLLEHAFIAGNGNGEALVDAERAGGVDVDARAVDFGGGIVALGMIRAGVGIGAEICDFAGEDDVSASGFDGNVPFVAGDVPVELIVVVEEAKGVRDDVFNGNGASGIVGIGNKDFEFAVLALATGFIAKRLAVFVARWISRRGKEV